MRSAEAENRAYFREAYLNGEHGWGVTEPDPFVVKYLARLRELAPGGRLLDLGCGEGRHAIAGAGLGFRVTARMGELQADLRRGALVHEVDDPAPRPLLLVAPQTGVGWRDPATLVRHKPKSDVHAPG